MKKKKDKNYEFQIIKEYIVKLDVDEKFYIENRILRQIEWYDGKASEKHCRYKILAIISLCFTSIIPVLSIFNDYKYGIIVSGIIAGLSAASSVSIALINLGEFQDLWIGYRANCELLKSLLYRYLTHTGEFNHQEQKSNFEELVSIAESYMKKEDMEWKSLSHTYNKE